MMVGYILNKIRSKPKQTSVVASMKRYKWGLLIVGLTYTFSLTANFYAKTLAPNAGYITVIRTAVVLPMVLIGAVFFKEHVSKRQWVGLVTILTGLGMFALV